MGKTVKTDSPSFPIVTENKPLCPANGIRWQVVCGDRGHWRVGLYSPPEQGLGDIHELERHDCPELFLLLHGRVTLVLAQSGRLEEIPLEPGQPIIVTAPHSAYCPGGPHTGTTLVVERDAFQTEYRPVVEWLARVTV